MNNKNLENIDKSLFLKEIQVLHDVKGGSNNSASIQDNQFFPLRN